MIDYVYEIVINDRRLNLRETAEAAGISYKRVNNILYGKLSMRKLSARWIPHVLTIDQKHEQSDGHIILGFLRGIFVDYL